MHTTRVPPRTTVPVSIGGIGRTIFALLLLEMSLDELIATAAAGEAPVIFESCEGLGRGFFIIKAIVSIVLPKPIISQRKPPRTSLLGGGVRRKLFSTGL